MTFEEFTKSQAESTGVGYRRVVRFVGSALIAIALLTFFAAPGFRRFHIGSSLVTVMTLVAPMVLIFISLAINQFSTWFWNRRSRQLFQCRSCGEGATVAQAQVIATHNVCPYCSEAMFACEEIGEFVRVEESEVLRPQRSDEPPVELDESNANPYAPPVEAPRAGELQQRRNGCLWLIPNYFIVTWQAIGHLTRGREYSINQMNKMMASFGGAPISDRYVDSIVLGLKRRAWLWLVCTVVSPLIFVAVYLVLPGGGFQELPFRLIIPLVQVIFGIIVGAILFGLTLNFSPAPLKRFLQGRTPPIIAEDDEKTGVYGIMFLYADAEGVTFQQPNITIRYRCDRGGEVIFGLLDRDTLKEYRLLRELPATDEWLDTTIAFAPSLQLVAPDFRGDEIRLLPPRDMQVEVESFHIHLPKLV